MTSLQDTLPILNVAVPSLPGKLQAVARECEAFEQAARETLAVFDQRRAHARTLFEQLQHALEAVEEQAGQQSHAVEPIGHALPAAATEVREGAVSGAGDLDTAGHAAAAVLSSLATHLAAAGERTRSAHDDARQALDAVDALAESSPAALDRLADQVAAELESAKEAVDEEQAQLAEGVDALGEAFRRLLDEARTRLGRTRAKLEEWRAEQEAAVRTTLAELTEGRAAVEEDFESRLKREVRANMEREMEAMAAAMAEMRGDAAGLQAASQDPRERLESLFGAVTDLLGALSRGVEQVRQAAGQVGITW